MKRIDRPEKARAALAARIERDLHTLRRAGHVGDLHESHVGNLATSLSFYLPDEYTFGALELAACELVSPSTILKMPAPGSAEAIAEQRAERAANPTIDDFRKMRSPEDRLHAINEVEHRKRESQAANDAKVKDDKDRARLKGLPVGARLEAVNELGRFEKAVTKKTPTAEQMRKLDAARRLDQINLQIHNSRAENKGALQRLKTALTPKETE